MTGLRRLSNRAACVLLAGAALLTGCTKKVWITQYPIFYTKDLKSIAVVPFRSLTRSRQAGRIVSDHLARALMANGTYKVFSQQDLRALMDQRDLQVAFGSDTSAAAAKFRKLGKVQAILTGEVTTYSATSNRQRKRDPVYAYTRQGTMYVAGYRTYVHTRNEGNVTATAALIRVSDGTQIYATGAPARATAWAQGSPPRMDQHACLASATNRVAQQLLRHFAVIRRQIKLDPGKALRTASELYDNKWQYIDSFSANTDQMFVVLHLPRSCDRNRFRLTIVPKDQRTIMAEQRIVWKGKYSGFGYGFSPKKIAAKGGRGQYTVKFYSGLEPIMTRDFRIK